MKKSFKLLILLTLVSVACNEDKTTETNPSTDLEPVDPIANGDRLLGIAISSSTLGFDASFAEATKAGVDVVELNIPWNAIETSQGVYVDPNGLLAATAYYGQNGVKVAFSLAVINTVRWEVPNYLEAAEPNSPEFINAFNNMVDWFVDAVPDNVVVPSISIGNEVDLVLNGDADWNAYTEFYEATKDHISTNYPNIKVGVKTTVTKGLFGAERDEIININKSSDVIMLNYYPQTDEFQVMNPDTVFDDLDQITSDFPTADIYLTEVGYQSGDQFSGSSEAKQAEFYHHFFTAWDQHRNQISYVMINWLHDQSPEMIEVWKGYYGDDPALVEYLSTLGLRNYDGTDKQAWKQVLKEANARGWQ